MTSDLAYAWRVNCELNHLLLDAIPDDALGDRYSERTRTVASQFAHIHNVRVYHLQKRARTHAGGLAAFGRGAEPSREDLLGALAASDEAIAAMLDDVAAAEDVKSWPAPPASFLGYLCAHEAHHRGLTIVSLRISGTKIPKAVKDGLWAWSKRRSFDA